MRELDCPETKTPEGKVAKRFVDALVAKTTGVVINTTKADKYDRYLADVFLTGQVNDVAGLVEPGPGSATPATGLVETCDDFTTKTRRQRSSDHPKPLFPIFVPSW